MGEITSLAQKPSAYDIYIFLTAIGLTPGGSGTVHIYTKTIHRTTQLNRIHRTYITIQIHKHNNGDELCCLELFGNPFALASTKWSLSINRKSSVCVT